MSSGQPSGDVKIANPRRRWNCAVRPHECAVCSPVVAIRLAALDEIGDSRPPQGESPLASIAQTVNREA